MTDHFKIPLSSNAKDFYDENGFIVTTDCFDAKEIQSYKNEALAICRGDLGEVRGLSPALANETDDEVMARTLCIHFPYKVSNLFLQQVKHPSLVDILSTVIGPNVKCMQSMLFIKSAGKPGQAWHQDEDYIPTRDRSLTGCWLALDDATIDNGCLWVIPGSHKSGVLWPMHWHGNRQYDCSWEAYDFPYTDKDAIPVEVKAGSVVSFNGYLLHKSLPNVRIDGYRRALVNHYMNASSFLPWLWPEKPTGMATHDHRDIIMVCGKDPYAYKGIDDIMPIHVRPDGQGGCAGQDYDEDVTINHE